MASRHTRQVDTQVQIATHGKSTHRCSQPHTASRHTGAASPAPGNRTNRQAPTRSRPHRQSPGPSQDRTPQSSSDQAAARAPHPGSHAGGATGGNPPTVQEEPPAWCPPLLMRSHPRGRRGRGDVRGTVARRGSSPIPKTGERPNPKSVGAVSVGPTRLGGPGSPQRHRQQWQPDMRRESHVCVPNVVHLFAARAARAPRAATSQARGFERTEAKLGIKPGAHDDPITYHRLTK
jgi:hypothetical protein